MAQGYNPYKNPSTAALIALIGGIFGLPGIGHIYVGRIGRGMLILFSGLILFVGGIAMIYLIGIWAVPLLVVYPVIWIWQIFNARTLAKKFNEHFQATGTEPW